MSTVNEQNWRDLKAELEPRQVTLVAVSKTKPTEDVQALYELGQRDFGENYVQELVAKQPQLPADIRWHFIGHLQGNKVKYIAPFVHLIHAVDSFRLLQEINKQATRHSRAIEVLLQMHIAEEETKFGLSEKELVELLDYYEAQRDQLENVRIRGLMGMASFSDNEAQVRAEFRRLRTAFLNLKQSYFLGQDYFDTCSMGMSGDYRIAMEEGSTLVRIGSMLFGGREQK
jgi:pyridoxal phosphate enzyme (YggS family)